MARLGRDEGAKRYHGETVRAGIGHQILHQPFPSPVPRKAAGTPVWSAIIRARLTTDQVNSASAPFWRRMYRPLVGPVSLMISPSADNRRLGRGAKLGLGDAIGKLDDLQPRPAPHPERRGW